MESLRRIAFLTIVALCVTASGVSAQAPKVPTFSDRVYQISKQGLGAAIGLGAGCGAAYGASKGVDHVFSGQNFGTKLPHVGVVTVPYALAAYWALSGASGSGWSRHCNVPEMLSGIVSYAASLLDDAPFLKKYECSYKDCGCGGKGHDYVITPTDVSRNAGSFCEGAYKVALPLLFLLGSRTVLRV